MNKKTWLLIAIVFAIWICLFPFVVLGEETTYTIISPHNCYVYWRTSSQFGKLQVNKNVRLVMWKNSNNTTGRFDGMGLVSTEPFGRNTVSQNGNSLTCEFDPNRSYTQVNNYITVDGVNYYYAVFTGKSIDGLEYNVVYNDSGFSSSPEIAVYYTYGAGAIDPVEPVNWGLLRDTSYTTRIAGSGQAARQNIDVITWEKSIDTNGNDISECEVEVQAVYGKFTGNTLVDLWETDLQDFAISGSVSLGVLPANSGKYTVSWSKVIEDLNSFDFDLLLAHEVNQQIEKNGWYYQIRLLGPNDYIGTWQTLYTPLSMGAKASETVITQNNFDMSIYQVYQDLSTINNNTSITITYIDTDYTINNPSDGTEPEGGTNLWDVLKELINGVFQILAKLGDIVIGLIDGLFDLFRQLFTPPETIDNSVQQTLELNINNYIEDNQSDLHTLNVHMKQFETDMKSLANQYGQGNISSCVLTWEDVTIDLSLFNAGHVTLIQGGTYSFGELFGSMINAFGISYDQYQFFVSGVIYICLIVFINKKIVWFLHKS